MTTFRGVATRAFLTAGLALVWAGGTRAADAISSEGDGDVTISAPFADAPELKVRPDIPVGEIHEFIMDSADSKLFPGLRGPYKRKVLVYVPKQYVAGTAAPFIVCHDGEGYKKNLPHMLDNLIADKRLPVMLAIMVNSGGGDGRGSERGLEYDTVNDTFANFIETEVLPRVVKECNVTLTADPEGRATMGGSSGGAAAFAMGWFRPDLYHRILTYSGTYISNQTPKIPLAPHGAWEYHENLIPKSDPKPLRIWMECGDKDMGAGNSEASMRNWLISNQHMAAALKAKGYHYRYVFAQGAVHVDGKVVNQTLPDALVWLWRGYPIAK